jgi:hypothetical protein
MWVAPSIERLAQTSDGARSLRKSPAFTAVALLTLALSIGGTTVMFSVSTACSCAPPYAIPAAVAVTATLRGLHEAGTSFATFTDWRSRARSFADLAIWHGQAVNLTGTDAPERVMGALVGPNAFTLLGVSPRLGRTLSREDEERRDLVVVLSHGLWKRRFGGSTDAIGKTLEIDGRPFQIVGVMPEGFYFPTKDVQFWQPSRLHGLGSQKPVLVERSWTNRYNDLWRVVGRLGLEEDAAAAGRHEAIGRARRNLATPYRPVDTRPHVPMLVQIRTTLRPLWVADGGDRFRFVDRVCERRQSLLARGVARSRDLPCRPPTAGRAGCAAAGDRSGLPPRRAGRLASAARPPLSYRLGDAGNPGAQFLLDSRVLVFRVGTHARQPPLRHHAGVAASSGEAGDTLRQTGIVTGATAAPGRDGCW